MKKFLFPILLSIAFLSPAILNAQEFFDTSDAKTLFSLSGRIGFNTSNRTFPSGHYSLWNHNSWGLGMNLGALANLNFKEFFSLQPGIFFESRSGDFSYVTEYLDGYGMKQTYYEMGHLRAYYITIPIMAVGKFNLSDKIKWLAEIGPYFQIHLNESGQNDVTVLYREPQNNKYSKFTAEHKNFDVGLKIGTGLQLWHHYYIGVHYLAGFMDAWKLPAGGRNKSWQFSIGYDFN